MLRTSDLGKTEKRGNKVSKVIYLPSFIIIMLSWLKGVAIIKEFGR